MLDREAVRIIGLLQRWGIKCVLLKGPVLLQWLYDRGETRPYGDIDLLVSPQDIRRVVAILADQFGYEDLSAGLSIFERAQHSIELRSREGVIVDLHETLSGVRLQPTEAWEVFARHLQPFDLHGASVLAFDEAARFLHVVLHAAQHGAGEAKPLDDLERALQRVSPELISEAARLANELGAGASFESGLCLGSGTPPPRGREVGAVVATRTRGLQRHPGALRLATLADAPPRLKLRIAFRAFWPTPTFIRQGRPRSEVSTPRLLKLRLQRLAFQMRHLPRAAWAVRRSRCR